MHRLEMHVPKFKNIIYPYLHKHKIYKIETSSFVKTARSDMTSATERINMTPD